MRKIYVVNGPNLNLLGQREQEHYGTKTLADIHTMCLEFVQGHDCELRFEQRNCEGALIDLVHEAINDAGAIIINPGAYSHTSIALLDALKIFPLIVVEVHLSLIYKREDFRHRSYISQRADAVISGCGAQGYLYALDYVLNVAKKW